jgi:hypothetical protein
MPSLFAKPEKVLPLLSDKAVNSSISFKELMKRASHIKPYDPIPQVRAMHAQGVREHLLHRASVC